MKSIGKSLHKMPGIVEDFKLLVTGIRKEKKAEEDANRKKQEKLTPKF